MSERSVARIVIGLSVLLIVSEVAVVTLYGLRFELVFLPFVIFLASLGVVFGLTLLKGRRSEIESVSTRRARAMKDEKVRKLLEGYEVDEEFLSGRRKRNKKPGKKKASPEAPESFSKPVDPESYRDPFESIDPRLRSLAEGFGGFEQMVQKIETMDTVAFKRLQYALDMQGIEKPQMLQPIKKAFVKAAGGSAGLREELDHDEMEEYMEQTLTGRRPESKGGSPTYYLDINMDDIGGRMAPPPGQISHKPRDVIDQFKKSLRRK